MEDEPRASEIPYAIGENPGIDLTEPAVRDSNRRLRRMAKAGIGGVIHLGGELKDLDIDNVRFWKGQESGEVIAIIRRESSEHKKEIITAAVAMGLMIGAVRALQYKKRK